MSTNETNKAVAKTTSGDGSKGTSQPEYKKPNDEVEMAKLELERERLELQRAVENSKIEIERLKLEREKKFWNRNSGALITALVSLAAVVVSLSQVVSTWISQNRQLQIASIQKQQELEIADKQKAKELSLLEEQNRREWNLSAAKFVTDNRKAIFDGNLQEQRLFAKVIGTIFPSDVAVSLLEKLEYASPPSDSTAWREARDKVVRSVGTAKRVVRQKAGQLEAPAEQNPTDLARGSSQLPNDNSGGAAPPSGGPGGCRSTIADSGMICYLTGEDPDNCHYNCYPR